MDNFHIDLTSQGDLTKAMEIAFAGAPGGKAEAYRINDKGLVFYWHSDAGTTSLPFKLDAAGAADFARRWLAEQDYGPEPNHDGDNGRGWRLYNESWGRVDDCGSYSFVAVKPEWAMYGK